jgi:hypothetical protein
MAKTVFLLTRDLLFRSRLAGIAAAAGWEVTRDAGTCERAVVELGASGWEDRVGDLTGRGVPTLAFGSHVETELLRRARAAGATAVPNSQVEQRLRSMLLSLEKRATPGTPGPPS